MEDEEEDEEKGKVDSLFCFGWLVFWKAIIIILIIIYNNNNNNNNK